MSQYYGESQWPGQSASQPTWDHQTPPPARSGASSAIPREETAAFSQQLEEVDRAIDNLMKSGKMFGMQGRRELPPFQQPPHQHRRAHPSMGRGRGRAHGRAPSGPPGPRSHSVSDFGDARVSPHAGPGLQNFYASQRHQTSRGSNEAEQMMQAKRRMAAQRERELRNYHQEQQYNRTVLSDNTAYPSKPADRTLSPGSNMSDHERRELIARQRSALYGGASYAENDGFVNENGNPRPAATVAGLPTGPSSHRGPSPLAYDYSRGGPETSMHTQEAQRSRANSNASPQSNPPNSKGPFENAVQQANRTSNSSPGESPPRQGSNSNQGGNTVAPIGTRPVMTQAPNPALNKRSTTPLPSPLSHGFSAGNGNENVQGVSTSGPSSNPPSAAADGYNGWGSRSGWGKASSGLGVQASVWG